MIRPATPQDVAAAAALEASVLGADAWSAATVAAELTGPRRRAVVAVQDDVLVGYAVVVLLGDTADLVRIAVEAAHRRTGHASAMLAALGHTAARDGARRILLEVGVRNDPALACYASAGFAVVARRRRYYRDGSDALVLQHELAPLAPGGPVSERGERAASTPAPDRLSAPASRVKGGRA